MINPTSSSNINKIYEEFSLPTKIFINITALVVGILSLGYFYQATFESLVGRFKTIPSEGGDPAVEATASSIKALAAEALTERESEDITPGEPLLADIFWENFSQNSEIENTLVALLVHKELDLETITAIILDLYQENYPLTPSEKDVLENYLKFYLTLHATSLPSPVVHSAPKDPLSERLEGLLAIEGLAPQEIAEMALEEAPIEYRQAMATKISELKALGKTLQEAAKLLVEQFLSGPSGGARREEATLPDGRNFKIHKTVGDGSCGLHALFGTPDPETGTYYCDRTMDIRREFATHLGSLFPDHLPKEIESLLESFYLDFEHRHTPSAIRNSNELQELYKALKSSDSADKEVLFRKDKKVLEVYLELIKLRTYELDQNELLALAAFKGKELILVQPGWGRDHSSITLSKEPSSEATYIWFDHGHYEAMSPVED